MLISYASQRSLGRQFGDDRVQALLDRIDAEIRSGEIKREDIRVPFAFVKARLIGAGPSPVAVKATDDELARYDRFWISLLGEVSRAALEHRAMTPRDVADAISNAHYAGLRRLRLGLVLALRALPEWPAPATTQDSR